MKKALSLLLALGLLAGLLTVPASALSFDDAELYLDKVKSIKGSSYLVDFDGDGREELVFSKNENGCNTVEVWQGGSQLATMTDYYAGTMGDDDIFFARKNGKTYLVYHLYMYRSLDQSLTYYTVENGKWVEKRSKDYDDIQAYSPERLDASYAWEELKYTAKEHSAASQLKQVAEPAAPPKPEVPAAPLGEALPPAKAEAIAQLSGVYYSGDRAAMAMTRPQARAIQAQIAQYAAAAPAANLSDVYVSLFDAGAGIPGVFMAKGFLGSMTAPTRLSDGEVLYEKGACAIWTFQGGEALVPFPHLSAEDSIALYPSCVERRTAPGESSHCETNYYALGYGFLFDNPGTTLVEDHDWDSGQRTCYVNGARVTAEQYQEFVALWQGAGLRAGAGPGGGVEYIIKYMTPADQAAAALDRFVNAFTAYPATQTVELDGKGVEFQCYALKDEAGNPTNYVKLRDLAKLLDGTDAQFDVGWDGAVSVTTDKAYTPNGTELQTPFTGERTYADAAAATKVNGQDAPLSAFVLTDDQGGGYTYYKLRDLGQALGFHVDWSADRGVFIETDKPYAGAN